MPKSIKNSMNSAFYSNRETYNHWTRYRIPTLIYQALLRWLCPYSTEEIVSLIKNTFRINPDNSSPTALTEAYSKIKNIKTFIHTADFPNPYKFQKKAYLSYFFANDLVQVKYSKEFNQLDDALTDLLKMLTPKRSTVPFQNSWAYISRQASNKLSQLHESFRQYSLNSTINIKYYLTTQIFISLWQHASGYNSNNATKNHVGAIANAQFNITNQDHYYLNQAPADLRFYDVLNEPAFNQIQEQYQDKSNFYANNAAPQPEQTKLIPTNIQKYIRRIEKLISLNTDDKVLTEIEKGLADFPDNIVLLTYKAHILLDIREFHKALLVAEQIKQMDENHPLIYFIRGSIYLEQEGNYTQALENYDKARALAPANRNYQLFYKIAQYFNQPENTLAHYLKNNNFNPLSHDDARFVPEAKLFCMAGKNSFIANSCRANFNKPKLNKLFAQAEQYHEGGELSRAIEYYDKVLALIPTDDPYYNPQLQYLFWQKSRAYFGLRNYEKTKQALELTIAICIQPDNLADAYFEYGNTLINLFNQSIQIAQINLDLLKKACLAFKKAYKLRPEDEIISSMYTETHDLLASFQVDTDRPRQRV